MKIHRTIFVISEGAFRNVPQLDSDIELEIKGIEKNIMVKQPFRTTVLECVMDYCRVAFDIMPKECAFTVVMEQRDEIRILNNWDQAEQNFLHMGQRFAESAYISSDQQRIINNTTLFQKLFDHLFGDVTVRSTYKTTAQTGTYKIFYIAPVCTKENIPTEQPAINDLFSTFSTQLASRFTAPPKCTLDVILPLIGAPRTFTRVTDKMVPASPLDPMTLWCIDTNKLWDVMMRQMAQKQFGFVVVCVQGIPMRDTGSKASNYDVELACKGFNVELSQDIFMKDSNLDLKWIRADPKHSIEQLNTTKSIHRITPIAPYTLPTLCLMKHLASGKPVTLSLASEYNTRHEHTVTHLMLQHGDDVYLHVLHLSRTFTPWLTMPRLDEEENDYRMTEFAQLAKKSLIRAPSSSEISKEDGGQYTCLMNHMNFVYNTSTAIERQTRVFPICAEADSVLFAKDFQKLYPALHIRVIAPMMAILCNRQTSGDTLTDQEFSALSNLISKIYNCYNKNDMGLVAVANHTQRWGVYRKLWGELRSVVITMNFQRVVAIMDKLWPNYFSDQKDKGDDSKKGRKAVEVERDRFGNVIYPIQLGSLTIHSVGHVVYDRPAYHTDKYIWPVGYKSTRYYTSLDDTNNRCMYTCEIQDGGENPVFLLTSEDSPDKPIKGASATAVWTVIVKKINEIKTEEAGKRVFTNVSGPEYFGLAHPTVMKLISELPNAEKCIRPNAPHQPETQQLGDMQSGIIQGTDDAMSSDEDSQDALEKPTEVPPVRTEEDNAQNVDLMIAMRRKKRDELANTARENCKREMTAVGWSEGQDLFNFAITRSNAMLNGFVDLDGRKNGEELYAQFLPFPEEKKGYQKKKKKLPRNDQRRPSHGRPNSPQILQNPPAYNPTASSSKPSNAGQKRKFSQTD